jgi:TonB family protein
MYRKLLLVLTSLLLVFAASNLCFTQDRLPGSTSTTSRREVPEATLPASSEELSWWQKLRTAGETVRKNYGHKGSDEFARLVQEGRDHSYQVPVSDSKPIVLSMTLPEYTESARHAQVSGTVELNVEFRSDGLIGKVEVSKGLRSDLDQKAIEAAQRTVFLPAVKDRKFETDNRPMVMSFNIY